MSDRITEIRRIVFVCHVLTDEFRAFARAVVAMLPDHGFAPIESLWAAGKSPVEAGEFESAIAALAKRSSDTDDLSHFLQLQTAKDVNGEIKTYTPKTRGDAAFCTLELRFVVQTGSTTKEGLAFQSGCADLCKSMMAQFKIHSVELRPEGAGGQFLPDVALVDGCSHIAIATRDEVTGLYDDPAAFWSAGWTIAAEHGGQRLLVREMDVVAGPDYFSRIIDHQWAMARAAKAHETGYKDPQVLPDEEKIFRAGAARLEFVGYSATDKLIEYSCVLSEGQHIPGWEVFALRNIVETGLTPDGKAVVQTVRVVFIEEWMAQSEKRPLLDIGCKLFYYAPDGVLQEIVD